jgi:hypothetical protein
MSELPPCGLYRTRRALGDVAAGRLVYFHNHGDPGPGLYLPRGWKLNRAQWHANGVPLPDAEWARHLEPLLPEGLYRVREAFTCCEQNCHTYEPDLLVQLGYNGAAEPLLFVPEWTEAGLAVPEQGARIDADRVARLAPLKVAAPAAPATHDLQ